MLYKSLKFHAENKMDMYLFYYEKNEIPKIKFYLTVKTELKKSDKKLVKLHSERCHSAINFFYGLPRKSAPNRPPTQKRRTETMQMLLSI